jgi:hypothetical protein
MSPAQFSQIVDKALADGKPLNEALSIAGHEDAHHRDPFDIMREGH